MEQSIYHSIDEDERVTFSELFSLFKEARIYSNYDKASFENAIVELTKPKCNLILISHTLKLLMKSLQGNLIQYDYVNNVYRKYQELINNVKYERAKIMLK